VGAIVITGSSRGIGFGLAEAFLDRGRSVVVSGRDARAVDDAVGRLRARHREAKVVGHPCDVTVQDDLESLWEIAARELDGVDVWINNAGTCNAARAFVDLSPGEIATVLSTNVTGTVLASRVALRGFIAQGHGKLFNMEGWGSRGEWSAGLTPYATTKRALRYFTDALVREMRGQPVQVGTLSPGMVATDLLVSSWERGAPENWLRMRWLFRFVIDPPEPVCAFLADRVLASRRSGLHVTWMTPWRLLRRFFQPRYWRRRHVAALEKIGT
jgi:NAD(P)-dependent dehydrogenase (short-subunit alcohol dehydrogenase family)